MAKQVEILEAVPETATIENEDFLTRQLVTYIGNKRALLGFIGEGLAEVKRRLGRDRLDLFDVFSGSGIVSRFFKRHARRLVVNDLERYAEVISECYLANRSGIDIDGLRQAYDGITSRLALEPLRSGFIAEMYAPGDDEDIQPGERAFFTRRNAEYIDTARRYIDELPPRFRCHLLAPLLSEASIHANTSGVFKGFHKDGETGIGRFGGRNGDALSRIKGAIALPFPVYSDFECEVEIHRGNSNTVCREVDGIDVAYIDPPYNQHPYGSNYFMLNLIADYERPESVSTISGIPADWLRSDYNSPTRASTALLDLVSGIRAKFLLVSFNSEGFISQAEMRSLLSSVGEVEVLETRYNAFKGSRNLRGRDIHVTEYLYLVEKS